MRNVRLVSGDRTVAGRFGGCGMLGGFWAVHDCPALVPASASHPVCDGTVDPEGSLQTGLALITMFADL